jgi:hypothetical protein
VRISAEKNSQKSAEQHAGRGNAISNMNLPEYPNDTLQIEGETRHENGIKRERLICQSKSKMERNSADLRLGDRDIGRTSESPTVVRTCF